MGPPSTRARAAWLAVVGPCCDGCHLRLGESQQAGQHRKDGAVPRQRAALEEAEDGGAQVLREEWDGRLNGR